jgi:rhamnulokinase
MGNKILAFDLGASSGRAMLGNFDGEKIELVEIHRFSNDPVMVNGTLYWDILRLLFEIKQGIIKAKNLGGFDSIGIDTWGVDFGLIAKDGKMLSNPVHYRDSRTVNTPEKIFEKISKKELFNRTGLGFMRLNTIYQIYYLLENESDLLSRCDKMLNTPDLLAYFLTGEKRSEKTIASTTNLLNPHTKEWDFELIKELGLPSDIFAKIINTGEVYGNLSDEICEELGCESVPVVAVGCHDTASAVVSAPIQSNDFIYISCGTWSLFGIESESPIITDEAYKSNFSNETGINNTTRFLKSIMGLWLIQESKRAWEKQGIETSFDVLEKEALEAEPFKCFIDVDDSTFESAGNMPKRVSEFCKRTNQYVPTSRGEIVRCIYDSLALKYKDTFINLEKVSNRKYSSINMLGGGIKDKLLCQMTANACNVTVLSGPVEATSMGNIATQLISLGAISSLKEAREIIKASTDITTYIPQNSGDIEKAYEKYSEIVGV